MRGDEATPTQGGTMAGDLKAVVEITADTTGLIKGVDGAMKKLETASGLTAAFTGIEAATRVIGFAEKLFGEVRGRMNELDRMALTWSPAAISAQMDAEISKLTDEQKIGTKMGPYTAAAIADQMKAEQANADRTAANADQIGQGKLAWQQIWNTTIGARDFMVDRFLGFSGQMYDNAPKAIGNAWLSNLSGGLYNQDEKGEYRFSTAPVVDVLNDIKLLLKGK
jgi:hypothetical protein